MNKNSKIFIAGANTMVGSAIIRELQKEGVSKTINWLRENNFSNFN
jgi:nucleoside-diphosphate-sugar epimerase